MRNPDPYLLAVACGVAVGYLGGSLIAGAIAFWVFLWGFEALLRRPQPAGANWADQLINSKSRPERKIGNLPAESMRPLSTCELR